MNETLSYCGWVLNFYAQVKFLRDMTKEETLLNEQAARTMKEHLRYMELTYSAEIARQYDTEGAQKQWPQRL